jgi:hypothetical protein
VCIAHDGDEWPLDAPDMVVPPLHPNCRSELLPVFDWTGLGVAPPEMTRRFATYEDWLRQATPEEQRRVLGAQKALLYRAGKVTLADLIAEDGRRIPLRELRRVLTTEQLALAAGETADLAPLFAA